MLFENEEEFELHPKRTKTLLISIGIHALLLIFLALNPDLLTSTPKRIIRNAPAGKETSGFGNPYAVAYDSKRHRLFVTGKLWPKLFEIRIIKK